MVCIKIELGWFDFVTLLIWVVMYQSIILMELHSFKKFFYKGTFAESQKLCLLWQIFAIKERLPSNTQMILNIFLCGLHISLIAKIIIPLIKIPFICPNWSIKTYRVYTPISLNRSDLEPFDNQWASNDEDDDQDVVEKSYLGKQRSISTT